jgi:hypothetical protein
VSNAVTGVVFIGTPFRGAGNLTSKQLISSIQAHESGMNEMGMYIHPEILSALDHESEVLINAVNDYSTLSNYEKEWIKSYCFFEQRATPVGLIIGHPKLKVS